MNYKVKKANKAVELNGNWQDSVWQDIEAIELKNFMGDKPEHFPKTQAKAVYDDENIYVFFRVEDNYVRAIAEKYNDCVCRDSCVEFFFSPDTAQLKKYMNLEINCGGTVLLHYNDMSIDKTVWVDDADCAKVQVYHSLDKIIEPEIAEPTNWFIQAKIPFEVVGKYAEMTKPAKGVKWNANFYKCADATSHPHWLTWNKVDYPQPRFHLPEFFGIIEFE